MASRKITKRKSPCQEKIFFDVNVNDLSPEHSSNEDSEPEIKVMKTDVSLKQEALERFNLETDKIVMDGETFIPAQEDPKEVVSSCEERKNIISCESNSEVVSTFLATDQTDKTSASVPNDQADKTFERSSNDLEDGELNETVSSNKQVNNTNSKVLTDSEIHVCFGNKKLADLYKFKFIKFLNSFIELEIIEETDLSVTFQRDPLLNPSDWIIFDEIACSSQLEEENLENSIAISDTPTKSKKKKAKKKKKDDDLFVLDTNPSHYESNSLVAKYSSKFQIEIEQKADEDNTPKRTVSIQTCFNCNENHSLKDCPLPRIPARINAARNKFKAQKQTT